jgi:cytochrome c556
MIRLARCLGLFSVVLLMTATSMAAVPKVSTFAPSKNLVSQMQNYIDNLSDLVEGEPDYEDNKNKVVRNSTIIAALAMVLGNDDMDNKYKTSAAGMIKAAGAIAIAKDYAAAKQAYDQLVEAINAKAGGEVKWEKVAPLSELMEAVPLISAKIRNSSLKKKKRFDKKAEEYAGYTAVLAALAQASMYNSDETDKPEETEQWYADCADFQEKAHAVTMACLAGDNEAATEAVKAMKLSCEACHETFHNEEEEKEEAK